MSFTLVNGIRIHYHDLGKGKPLVFLHGLGGDSGVFYHQIKAFSRSFRCISLDLRGFGKSNPLDGIEGSLEICTDDLRDTLLQLEIGQKATLLGHSFGGMIALQYTLTYPEDVERLVIIDSTSEPNLIHSPLNKLVFLLPLIKPRWITPSLRRFYALKLTANYKCLSEELKGWLIKEADKTTDAEVKSIMRYAHEMFHWNVSNRLGQIKAPTLIFRGEKDILVKERAVEVLYKGIPDSYYIVIEKAGHCPLFERAEVFNQVLGKFLRGESLERLPDGAYWRGGKR